MAASPTMCGSACTGSMPRNSPHADHTDRLHGMNAVLVPGGFGERGAEGKIAAVTYAREKQLPFLGICFGMQLACVEAARTRPAQRRLVDRVRALRRPDRRPDDRMGAGRRVQKRGAGDNLGGTMRLGAYPCLWSPGSLARAVYGGAEAISERHRHRYEVNINYRRVSSRRACASPACPRTAACPRWSNCRTIPGLSACSSTRS